MNRILRVFDHLEPLCKCLHHAVLDAVVDHLDEVASAVWSDQAVAVFRGERLDRRFDSLECLGRAAGHDRITHFQAPDATASAAVDDLVAAAGQAVDHVAAHAAEANEAKLHTEILLAQSRFGLPQYHSNSTPGAPPKPLRPEGPAPSVAPRFHPYTSLATREPTG